MWRNTPYKFIPLTLLVISAVAWAASLYLHFEGVSNSVRTQNLVTLIASGTGLIGFSYIGIYFLLRGMARKD